MSVTGRPRKMSDEDVRAAMLDSAWNLVMETGLTVSLGHLPYERIIATSGVSRSAAYRLFASKEDFFRELVVYLSLHTDTSGLTAVTRAVADAVLPLLAQGLLATRDGRRTIFLEAIRAGAVADQSDLLGNAPWRTHVALTATLAAVVDDEDLHGRMATGLVGQQVSFYQAMAGFYETVCGYVGLRPKPGFDYVLIAQLGSAFAEGLGMNSMADPRLQEPIVKGKPFGGLTKADWSMASLGIACILDSTLEEDPNYDETRADALATELADLLRALVADLDVPGS